MSKPDFLPTRVNPAGQSPGGRTGGWVNFGFEAELKNTPSRSVGITLDALQRSPLRGEMNVMRSALHSEGCSAVRPPDGIPPRIVPMEQMNWNPQTRTYPRDDPDGS